MRLNFFQNYLAPLSNKQSYLELEFFLHQYSRTSWMKKKTYVICICMLSSKPSDDLSLSPVHWCELFNKYESVP